MKKLLLAISIALSINSMNVFAESAVNASPDYWTNIDEKYSNQVIKMDFKEAVDIEREPYSTPEELYIAGLFFYGDKNYKNLTKAANLFAASANNDFQPAKYMLGKMSFKNETNILTKFEARELLKEIKGDYYYEGKASELLVESYLDEKDYNKAISYLSRLKTKESLYKIAKIYEYKGDKETANLIYREAIVQGHVDAKIELAKRYLHEDALNTNKAISLLLEVANKGKDLELVSKAQTLLGDIYFYGNQEIYANHEKGVEWYKKASNNNYHEAMLKLHEVYLENEAGNKYRLGSNKFYIHDLGVKIRKEIYKENI